MNIKKIPSHIAIIMDGNGRWAQLRNLPRTSGHKEGIKRIKEIVSAAAESGVKVLTFFAFSTENWSRPKSEVNMLMRSLDNFLKNEVGDLKKNNIRFRWTGSRAGVADYLIERIKKTEALTEGSTGLIVNLAFNYGSRLEIVDAAKSICQHVMQGKLNIQDIDENTFADFLYTKGLPDPDLLIRTSGEMRVSNFLLWQLSYAEFYFVKKYWPDFGKEDFLKALKEFQLRVRRFGGLDGSSN